MKLETGKTYQVHTQRFGRAKVKVLAVSEEWVETEVVEGELVGMRESWGVGDNKTLRISHIYSAVEVPS